mgnify:CR=1 FL=1
MADKPIRIPLTGHGLFDALIADFSDIADPAEQETARARIWDEFGTEGAVLISDMASFSSTSRKIGVCHFLKLIHRARQTIAPIVAANNGTLLKCDADNCYAFFERPDDAIRASFEVNSALFESNDRHPIAEQIYLSVGIDYGRVLLIDGVDFFGDPRFEDELRQAGLYLGSDWSEDLAGLVTARLRMPGWLRPAVAGAMLGALAIWFPHIIGVGYETTSAALTGGIGLSEAIAPAGEMWSVVTESPSRARQRAPASGSIGRGSASRPTRKGGSWI